MALLEQRHMLPIIVQQKNGVDYTENGQDGLIIESEIIKLTDSKNLEEDALEWINSRNTYSTSYTSYSQIEEKDERTVYFYELSNIEACPTIFKTVSSFVKWAKDNNIIISSYTESTLRSNLISFCTCYKTSAALMIRRTYQELKKDFESHLNYIQGNYNPRDYNYSDDYYYD